MLKTAEMATLFKAVKQETNTALANELAVLCESANVDYFEVSKTSEFSDPSFWPTTVRRKQN